MHRLAVRSHVSPTIPIPTIPRLVSTAEHDMCRIVGHEMSGTCMSYGLEHAAAATASPSLPTSCMSQSHIVSFYRNYTCEQNAKASSNQQIDWRRAFPAHCQWYHARVHSIHDPRAYPTLRADARSKMLTITSVSSRRPDNALLQSRMSHYPLPCSGYRTSHERFE